MYLLINYSDHQESTLHFLPFTFIIKMHKRLTSYWRVILIWHEPIWPDYSLFFLISELWGTWNVPTMPTRPWMEGVKLSLWPAAGWPAQDWGEGLNSLLFHILEGFSWPVLTWQECALGLLGCCQSLGPETGVTRILPKIRLRNLDAGWQFKQQLQPNWHRWKNLGESKWF